MKTVTHTYANEYDGSIVIDGLIVCSPSADFPASTMREMVHAANCHAELVEELRESNALLADIITGKHAGGKEMTLCHRRIELNRAAIARAEGGAR